MDTSNMLKQVLFFSATDRKKEKEEEEKPEPFDFPRPQHIRARFKDWGDRDQPSNTYGTYLPVNTEEAEMDDAAIEMIKQNMLYPKRSKPSKPIDPFSSNAKRITEGLPENISLDPHAKRDAFYRDVYDLKVNGVTVAIVLHSYSELYVVTTYCTRNTRFVDTVIRDFCQYEKKRIKEEVEKSKTEYRMKLELKQKQEANKGDKAIEKYLNPVTHKTKVPPVTKK